MKPSERILCIRAGMLIENNIDQHEYDASVGEQAILYYLDEQYEKDQSEKEGYNTYDKISKHADESSKLFNKQSFDYPSEKEEKCVIESLKIPLDGKGTQINKLRIKDDEFVNITKVLQIIEEKDANIGNVDELIGDYEVIGREKEAFAHGYNQALTDITTRIKEL